LGLYPAVGLLFEIERRKISSPRISFALHHKQEPPD
jgi:hypothetical protein